MTPSKSWLHARVRADMDPKKWETSSFEHSHAQGVVRSPISFVYLKEYSAWRSRSNSHRPHSFGAGSIRASWLGELSSRVRRVCAPLPGRKPGELKRQWGGCVLRSPAFNIGVLSRKTALGHWIASPMRASESKASAKHTGASCKPHAERPPE